MPSWHEFVADLKWSARERAARWICRPTYSFSLLYIPTRLELPHILNARKLFGEGAEIGVQKGEFSQAILQTWRGKRLYSIDPWRRWNEDVYDDVSNVSQAEQDSRCQETIERLSPFGERSNVMRMTSQEAAASFADGQLDFVYIDAQHHYEAVRDDLKRWYPKVKAGGFLAGHDYLDGQDPAGAFGVRSAVDEFASAEGLRCAVSREKLYASWFIPIGRSR